jgi:hypothetical protein
LTRVVGVVQSQEEWGGLHRSWTWSRQSAGDSQGKWGHTVPDSRMER